MIDPSSHFSATWWLFLQRRFEDGDYYKSEGRWFDSRWCHCNFSLTKSFQTHYDHVVDCSPNQIIYQDHFQVVMAAGA